MGKRAADFRRFSLAENPLGLQVMFGRLDNASASFDNRRTEVVCTIGPACRAPKKLIALMEAGMNVARLHFAYADHAEHAVNIERIRRAEKFTGRRAAVLQDLSGTKVRMGEFAEGSVNLEEGAEFVLMSERVQGDRERVSLNFPELIPVVSAGDTVLLGDGVLRLEALAIESGRLRCKVVKGGRVKSRQAVHVPGKAVPLTVPTAKDLDDASFGIQHGVDWIAQSFATSAGEINALHAFIRQQGSSIPVVAKIERREAWENLDEIIQAADAVMVARGDLGLDLPIEQIALVQKHIIRRAKAAQQPVITATEMLTSMMKQPHPTRAEVTDVTNAILDGSDAVMLSGETGVGRYPIESTSMMTRIAAVTDDYCNRLRGSSPLETAF